MQGAPKVGSHWRHKVGKGTYVVLDNDTICERTLEVSVQYKADADGTKWWRPLHEFMDGRFEEIPIKELRDPSHKYLHIAD